MSLSISVSIWISVLRELNRFDSESSNTKLSIIKLLSKVINIRSYESGFEIREMVDCEISSNEEVTMNDDSIMWIFEITEFEIVTLDKNWFNNEFWSEILHMFWIFILDEINWNDAYETVAK